MDADWFAEGPDLDWFQVSEELDSMEEALRHWKDNGLTNAPKDYLEELHARLESDIGWLQLVLAKLRRHHHTRPADV
jgi:hypothetical protein